MEGRRTVSREGGFEIRVWVRIERMSLIVEDGVRSSDNMSKASTKTSTPDSSDLIDDEIRSGMPTELCSSGEKPGTWLVRSITWTEVGSLSSGRSVSGGCNTETSNVGVCLSSSSA